MLTVSLSFARLLVLSWVVLSIWAAVATSSPPAVCATEMWATAWLAPHMHVTPLPHALSSNHDGLPLNLHASA